MSILASLSLQLNSTPRVRRGKCILSQFFFLTKTYLSDMSNYSLGPTLHFTPAFFLCFTSRFSTTSHFIHFAGTVMQQNVNSSGLSMCTSIGK